LGPETVSETLPHAPSAVAETAQSSAMASLLNGLAQPDDLGDVPSRRNAALSVDVLTTA
jgi:hypothetical protein